jgi:Uncharacterised nucleotidyltransferase
LSPYSKSSLAEKSENEFSFLCALAARELTPARIDQIANLNLSALDWSEFCRLAEHHGVLPLVARNLIEYCYADPDFAENARADHDHTEQGHADRAHRLPREIERSLRSAYEANLKRSLWFAAELGRIIRHFEYAKLHAVPYKGPVLAQSAYHDVALRSFSDLDFLIAPADFIRAKQALAEIGYRPSEDVSLAVERFWLRKGNECEFDGAAGKYLVELQWALLPYYYGVDLRVEDLIARAGRTVVGECEMPSLSPEDSVLVLCLHAAKHLWMRLIWLVDIAESLRIPSIDYALIFSRARDLGITRILGVSFWLVKEVLRIELPRQTEEMIDLDPRVPTLGEEFAKRIARSAMYDFESTEYFRLILKLREQRGDRWRYLWRLVWTPGVGDISAVQLPEPLFPLYRIVRMGRLIKKLSREP